MKPYSITRRLVLWLTLSVTAFWVTAAGLGASVMFDEFGEIFDSAMQETAERLMPLVLDDLIRHEPWSAPRRLQKSESAEEEYLTYQVRDASGKVLLHSYDTAAVPFKAPLQRGFWQDETSRVFTTVAAGSKIYVQVADSLAHRMEATQEGALALFLPILFLVPISIAAMLFIVRRVTAPVASLRRAIAAKDSGNLSPIALTDMPSELRPIGNSINLLLNRLNAALGAEREFTANSAHELRTPVAGAIAQMQVLIEELDQSKSKARALVIEQSLQRLSFLIEKLLQLSRAEAGIGSSDTPRDLIPIMRMVVEDFRSQVGLSRQIDFITPDGQRMIRSVNPDALAIVLRNLVENALHHGDDEAPVVIRIESDARVIVSNRARHIDPQDLDKLRKRFVRGNELSPGSGLGLSIVDRLLAQMNASLELRSRLLDQHHVFEAIVNFHG